MIEKSTLPGENLPDGTADSQRAPAGNTGANASDTKRGYSKLAVERINPFDPQTTGEDPVGDPYNYGGFLGRPQGFQR